MNFVFTTEIYITKIKYHINTINEAYILKNYGTSVCCCYLISFLGAEEKVIVYVRTFCEH